MGGRWELGEKWHDFSGITATVDNSNDTCCLLRCTVWHLSSTQVRLEWHFQCAFVALSLILAPRIPLLSSLSSSPSTCIIRYPHGLYSLSFCQFFAICQHSTGRLVFHPNSIAQASFNSFETFLLCISSTMSLGVLKKCRRRIWIFVR